MPACASIASHFNYVTSWLLTFNLTQLMAAFSPILQICIMPHRGKSAIHNSSVPRDLYWSSIAVLHKIQTIIKRYVDGRKARILVLLSHLVKVPLFHAVVGQGLIAVGKLVSDKVRGGG